MKDLVELENEFEDVKGDSLSIIRFFENNRDDIEYLDASIEPGKSFKSKLYGDYGLSLAVSGNTNKALKILDAFVPSFEKELENYSDEHKTLPYYELLLWTYGYTLHDVERYHDAETVFAKLVEFYPDNSKYKKWLAASKTNRYSKIRHMLWIGCFILLAIDFLFEKGMAQGAKNAFWIMVGLTIILTLSLELYTYIINKRHE